MKTPDEIKILTKIFPKIKADLKAINDYAQEFLPKTLVSSDRVEKKKNFPEAEKTMLDLVHKGEKLLPSNYSAFVQSALIHDWAARYSGLDEGASEYEFGVSSNPDDGYSVSTAGKVFYDNYRSDIVFNGAFRCGQILKNGKFKSGRVSYGGLFMYDDTIARIKEERELAKTPKLLKFLKSNNESKINLAIQQLFNSQSELSIINILQILKEWPLYEPILKSKHKDNDDLEALAISISENKTRFTKEAKAKIIPYCNATKFDVQYLAMKTMKGKWTRADKEKLTKILVRGNFAIQLLKLEAMTKIKHPDTATLAHKLLKDINELVRNAAIDALGEIGKEKELNSLQNIGKDAKKRDMYDPGRLIKAINGIKDRLVK